MRFDLPFARTAALAIVALASAVVARDAQAMSYLMMRDDTLLAQSPVVVSGEVVSVLPLQSDKSGFAVEKRYAVRIDRVLKGAVDASLVVLALPGAPEAEAGLHVPGVPQFVAGDDVLVFAEPRADGAYAPVQLALGLFRAHEYAGDVFYQRELETEDAIEKSFNAEYTLPRHAAKFEAWIEANGYAAQSTRPDYLEVLPPEAAAKFTHMRGASTGSPTRWFKFDSGLSEAWYGLSGGQANMTTNVFTQLQNAVNAWTNDAGSRINLTYGGQTGTDAQNDRTDGRSAVTWNDPDNKISGSFSCTSGGTLAIGGPYFSGTRTSFNGTLYHTIVEGFVVVQDGAGCLFDRHGGADGAETLAHEIGHTLGLGHACGDGSSPACNTSATLDAALMRASVHGDGRGALLGSDDQLAVVTIYPASSGGVPPPTKPDPVFKTGFE
ncbi:MAG TPA: hypothetical protein VND91_10450 [Candidatus Saccharimonadia bacterium]|nr:hypothetical protein [Candidatus Saccharimonadia bacterium]